MKQLYWCLLPYSTKAQNITINIDANVLSVGQLLDQIEHQSDYLVVFRNKEVDTNRSVAFHKRSGKIETYLDEAFKGTDITYSIDNKYILLYKKNEKKESAPIMQQAGKRITGTITDKNGEPIIGANIVEKGTTNGTVSDLNGKFSLAIQKKTTLIVSFIGYQQREIEANGTEPLKVILSEDTETLEEVVVVGYGTQKKKDLTGSITSISKEQLGTNNSLSFNQVLQGKVAGVQISQTNGAPGGYSNILVRGINSISGSNSPLYVIDGFPIGTQGGGDLSSFAQNSFSASSMSTSVADKIDPLSTINPADIESIDILKDASATAIYGSRGANGVIIITTKKGKIGKTTINADVSFGVQEVANKLDLMNPKQYAEFVAEGRDNVWIYSGGKATDPNSVRTSNAYVLDAYRHPESLSTKGTDWQDEIFRLAPVQNYQLSATGGTEGIKYMVSAGYYNQQGIVIGSDYKRFSVRSNIEAKLTNRLKFGSILSGSYGYGDFARTEGHLGLRGMIQCALALNPLLAVYNDDGSLTTGLGDPYNAPVENPLLIDREFSDKRDMKDFMTNNYLDLEIIKGLNLRSSIGATANLNQTKLWKSSKIGYYVSTTSPATAAAIDAKGFNWLNENTLTFKRLFNGIHDVNAVFGFTVQKDTYNFLSAGATDFPTDYVTYLEAGTINSGSHYKSEWSMASLLGRVNYIYDGKYMLTATIRRDGSSRFAKGHKWGTFPSASLGYNISEEKFMKNIKPISNLKLRLSYGESGNNAIGNYNHISLLNVENYVDNNKKVAGLAPSSTMANNELTWEKSKQTNIGLDFGLFNNRISLTADWYYNLKTNLLMSVSLPGASEFTQSVKNVGEVENKGLEISLNTVNIEMNNFRWNSSFNISTNQNKVKKMYSEGAKLISGNHITEVGESIASFYLMHVVGIFQNEEEIKNNPVQNPKVQPGDLKFEDVNHDGKITTADKTVVGSPFPDYTWGFNNEFKYKNLSLSIFLNGSHGNDVYFQAGETILNSAGVQNQLAMVDKRWKSESDPGDGIIPRAIRSDYALGMSASSRYLFDGSYVRIKDITLSYDIPSSLLKKIGIKGMNTYFNVSNVYTFTDYPGYDPEASNSGSNILNAGVDNGTYPTPRTYTIGLKFLF